jgi:hypothetical protein
MESSNETTAFDIDLENFACDLLTEAKNQAAVQRLFEAKKAHWVTVRDLCSTVSGLQETYEELSKQLPSDLVVTWLDCPGDREAQNNAVVLFFVEDLLWSKIAVFNRGGLSKRKESKPRKATTGTPRGK